MLEISPTSHTISSRGSRQPNLVTIMAADRHGEKGGSPLTHPEKKEISDSGLSGPCVMYYSSVCVDCIPPFTNAYH